MTELNMAEIMAYAAKKEAAVKTREELRQLRDKFYVEHNDGPASVLKAAVQGKTKEEVQQLAMQLPAFPAHLFDFLSDYGFVTGSTVYGNIDQANDVDWMIEYMPQLTYIMTPYVVSYDYSDNYEAAPGRLSVLYGNIEQRKLLNIIVANDYGLFKAWKYATACMKTLKMGDITKRLMQNKYARVRLFRAFVDAYDSMNTEVKDLEHYDKPATLADAREYKVCLVCGREALWFTEKAREAEYHATGVCERCQDV